MYVYTAMPSYGNEHQRQHCLFIVESHSPVNMTERAVVFAILF